MHVCIHAKELGKVETTTFYVIIPGINFLFLFRLKFRTHAGPWALVIPNHFQAWFFLFLFSNLFSLELPYSNTLLLWMTSSKDFFFCFHNKKLIFLQGQHKKARQDASNRMHLERETNMVVIPRKNGHKEHHRYRMWRDGGTTRLRISVHENPVGKRFFVEIGDAFLFFLGWETSGRKMRQFRGVYIWHVIFLCCCSVTKKPSPHSLVVFGEKEKGIVGSKLQRERKETWKRLFFPFFVCSNRQEKAAAFLDYGGKKIL